PSSPSFCTSHLDTCLSSPVIFYLTPPPHPDIYTLSLHDALPICGDYGDGLPPPGPDQTEDEPNPSTDPSFHSTQIHAQAGTGVGDRKSTRLNSSHEWISYAVFCLKKKKKTDIKRETHMNMNVGN